MRERSLSLVKENVLDAVAEEIAGARDAPTRARMRSEKDVAGKLPVADHPFVKRPSATLLPEDIVCAISVEIGHADDAPAAARMLPRLHAGDPLTA